MRLVQLKLAGFKSFVDPTVIPTPSHLVGVVGPNGCGKSNIIDAVRWVMGESRASELRGESMQDVIFNGSGQRKPSARASVELVFDNTQGRAAGQWGAYAEISVRRVLTRDGGSSYFINNQLVRRRDVYDIFLGTGLGARGYAIIGQGMINRLIEARPDELRVYLEEAAGVSRYKERRRETENRLRDTRDNLTRVDDILRELNSQLERLEAQAEVARRYRDLQHEGEQKQHLLWALREKLARQEQQDRFVAIEQAQTRLEGALASLRAHETTLESHRQAHYAASDAVHSAQGRLFEAGAQVSRLEAEIRHMTESRQRMRQRQQQLQQQVQQWQDQQEHCVEQIADAHDELDIAQARADDIAAKLEDAQNGMPDMESRVRQAADQREALRRAIARLDQNLALAQQARGDTERQLQALAARHDRLENELRDIQRPGDDALAQLQGNREALAAQQEDARAQLLELEGRLPGLEAARQQCASRARQGDTDVANIKARLDALTSLQHDVQKKNQLHPWLLDHGLDPAGSLWHALQVEPGWEAAFEAVLHERMAALPVSSLQQALTLAKNPPPARLALYQSATQHSPASKAFAGLQPMSALLRTSDPQLRALLAHWLSGVYACADLETALAVHADLPAGCRCVVPQGHLLDQHSIRFYAPDTEQAGLLARQNEITRLSRELKASRLLAETEHQSLENAEAAYVAASQALIPARTRMAELTERMHQVQLDYTQTRQMADQADEKTLRLRDDLAELAAEQEDLRASHEDLLIRSETLADEMAASQQEFERACESGDALSEQVESRQDAMRELERQHQEVAYSRRTLAARVAELRRTQQLAADQEKLAANELASLQGELFSMDEETARSGLQEALELRTRYEQALNDARIEHGALSDALRTADEERMRLEQSLEPLRAQITELQLKEQASRLAVEQYAEQLDAHKADRAGLQAVLDTAPPDWHKPAWLHSEVQRISRQIEGLGAVNLAALDELNAARERQQFLDAQYEDLSLAIETLEDAIRKIDRETRELLQTTFDTVNQHFGELFPQLFGGGEARLSMTGDEILDAGVQVMAQPPGKRNSTIHLLSGGEKALTAIALVFALFKLNPAPFCLLDEVDAPLDDANTERYAGLVSAMSEQTQFLFISHNKIAMQMARQLIGVTMQEQGVSRIVAVDMEAALEMAEA